MSSREQRVFFEKEVHSVAFSPDSRLLAVGLRHGVIVLYDVVDGEQVGKLSGHTKDVFSLAFLPSSGQLLASGSSDTTVRVWYVETCMQVALLEGHTMPVLCVAFSMDGGLLASVGESIRLWCSVDWSPAMVLADPCPTAVTFSPDNQWLAISSMTVPFFGGGGALKLWRLPDCTPGPEWPANMYCVRFSPNSKLLASGGGDPVLRLWDVGSDMHPRDLVTQHRGIVSLAFSPDGKQMVSCGTDDDRANGHLTDEVIQMYNDPGLCDRSVCVWDVAKGELLHQLTGHTNSVNMVAFAPNGNQVVSASTDKTVRIWTLPKWSDKTHRFFAPSFKSSVFCVICCVWRKSEWPCLPVEMWLEIFSLLQ
jgi:WD40 repeat protein